MNAEPAEILPLHRWTQLISHTASVTPWSNATALCIQ